jgi:hypothetical protein
VRGLDNIVNNGHFAVIGMIILLKIRKLGVKGMKMFIMIFHIIFLMMSRLSLIIDELRISREFDLIIFFCAFKYD